MHQYSSSNKGRFVELKVRDKKEDSVSIADELVEFLPELNITFNSLVISINKQQHTYAITI